MEIVFFKNLVNIYLNLSVYYGENMDNRDILFEKIQAKENEWKEQVEILRTRVKSMDSEMRPKVEERIDYLDNKLKEIKARTIQLKKISINSDPEIGNKIAYSWVELFTKIDNAMLKLKE